MFATIAAVVFGSWNPPETTTTALQNMPQLCHRTAASQALLAGLGWICVVMAMHFSSTGFTSIIGASSPRLPLHPSTPQGAATDPSTRVTLHARGGGKNIKCEDVKESILRRRQRLDKDLKNLKKFNESDKGHARELDTQFAGLEKDLARWDRLGCGDDDEVDGIRGELAKAKKMLNEKRTTKKVKKVKVLMHGKETIMSILDLAAVVGVSAFLIAFIAMEGPAVLAGLLGTVGIRLISVL